jgi:hypothetical protein
MDRIAETTQPLDVVADRAGGDFESVGELDAGPVARRLKQRQQAEQTC